MDIFVVVGVACAIIIMLIGILLILRRPSQSNNGLPENSTTLSELNDSSNTADPSHSHNESSSFKQNHAVNPTNPLNQNSQQADTLNQQEKDAFAHLDSALTQPFAVVKPNQHDTAPNLVPNEQDTYIYNQLFGGGTIESSQSHAVQAEHVKPVNTHDANSNAFNNTTMPKMDDPYTASFETVQQAVHDNKAKDSKSFDDHDLLGSALQNLDDVTNDSLFASQQPDSQQPDSQQMDTQTIDTQPIPPWTAESALFEHHNQALQQQDQEISLMKATQIIVMYLLPSNYRPLEGDKVLTHLKQYGLRFGEMSLFHRYEEGSGQGTLMFSVLKYTPEGAQGFDLQELSNEPLQGLAFFLAIPHEKALSGFDMMSSIASLLARDFSAKLYDEEMNPWSRERKDYYRHKVIQLAQA